jgi:hypothetical protein
MKASAGTRTPLPPGREDSLARDSRRLHELPAAELADLFDPGCSERCVVTLGALAAVGLLAPAAMPPEDTSGATPPVASAVATGVVVENFRLVAHGVVQAPTLPNDDYVGSLMNAPASVPIACTMSPTLPLPPADARLHITLATHSASGYLTLRYSFAAWPGWLGYWEHVAFVRQRFDVQKGYARLFPFRTAREALMTRLTGAFGQAHVRFCKEVQATAAVAGMLPASLDTPTKAKLCSKYGHHAAAFDALLSGRASGHTPARLQKLTAGVSSH